MYLGSQRPLTIVPFLTAPQLVQEASVDTRVCLEGRLPEGTPCVSPTVGAKPKNMTASLACLSLYGCWSKGFSKRCKGRALRRPKGITIIAVEINSISLKMKIN